MKQNLLFPDEDARLFFRAKQVPHPIPYQGSKRNLAPDILSYCPQKVHRFVEPFAGSAAMSLAIAYHKRAESFWLNDAHLPLANLWEEIICRPEILMEKYSAMWKQQLGSERKFYDAIRMKFNKTHEPACFLYLLARCVKAAIRYNSDGEFNNSPDNRRKGATPETMRCRVEGASILLRRKTTISALDYQAVLDACSACDLVYMDPPYQGVCGNRDNRYAPKFDREEFCEALNGLNKRKIMFLISYDGRTGEKTYGTPLPGSLDLTRIELHAGRSTQATLLGRNDDTYESLYLSKALAEQTASSTIFHHGKPVPKRFSG